jgi:hypothetical protein
MTSSTSSSLRSEWGLQYGGRHFAETRRIAQLEQFLDELRMLSSWRDHRRRGYGQRSRSQCGAVRPDLSSRQLLSLAVGETEQSDGLDDEVPTFRDPVDADEWISRWGFQATPGLPGLTRRGITIAVIDAPGHGDIIKNTA